MAFIYKKSKDNSLIVKDPIYGNIVIPYPFSEIVLTKEQEKEFTNGKGDEDE